MKKIIKNNVQKSSVQAQTPPINTLSKLPQVDSKGRFIIGSRKARTDEIEETASQIPNLERNDRGRVIIHSRYGNENNDMYYKDELSMSDRYPFEDDDGDAIDWSKNNSDLTINSAVGDCKKTKKKAKKKGGKKKKKKTKSTGKNKTYIPDKSKFRSFKGRLYEELDKRDHQIPNLLSEVIKNKNTLAVYNSNLYIYNKSQGCYIKKDKDQACTAIAHILRDTYSWKISDVKDSYQEILWNEDIQRKLDNEINTPLVNCKNGVMDMEEMTIHDHSSDYSFTSCTNASYDIHANGKIFKAFIKSITNGDKSLQSLIQEMMGYAFSSYVHAKKAFILYGPPDTGKSVLLNLIGKLIGEEYVSHIDIQRFSSAKYVAQINGKKLNIAFDTPSAPLTDTGTFKSLISCLDMITSKELYKNPVSQECTTKFLFGTNHFLKIEENNLNDVSAFFGRLIYIPLLNIVSEEDKIGDLAEQLLFEKDYIFTWALEGLKRLMDNNFVFTRSDISEKIKSQNIAEHCPEAAFCEEYLEFTGDSTRTPTEEIAESYMEYMSNTATTKYSKNSIKAYLENIKGLHRGKGTVMNRNGKKSNRAYYEGVRLK